MTPPTGFDNLHASIKKNSLRLPPSLRARKGVAIRIPCGALHRPAPPGPEIERIATACGLAMTRLIRPVLLLKWNNHPTWSALSDPALQPDPVHSFQIRKPEHPLRLPSFMWSGTPPPGGRSRGERRPPRGTAPCQRGRRDPRHSRRDRRSIPWSGWRSPAPARSAGPAAPAG